MSDETNSTFGHEVPNYHVSQEPTNVETSGQEVSGDAQNAPYATNKSSGTNEAHFPTAGFGAAGALTGATAGKAGDIGEYLLWKMNMAPTTGSLQRYSNSQIGDWRTNVPLRDLEKEVGLQIRTPSEVQDASKVLKGSHGVVHGHAVPLNPPQPKIDISKYQESVPKSVYNKVGRSPSASGAVIGHNLARAIAEESPESAALDVGAAGASAVAPWLPKNIPIPMGKTKLNIPARAIAESIGLIPVAKSVAEQVIPQKKAKGGLAHLAGGGGKFGAAADIAQRAAHEFANQTPGRVTDFLQHHLKKFVVPTQSDRMGGVGGVSFSANSLALPEYKGIAWGSGNKPVASGVTNLAKDERFGGPENQIFVPLIGEQNQHKSNQIVFNKLSDMYYKNKDSATPELREKINQFMRSGGPDKDGIPTFVPFSGFDIADKDMVNLLGQSFENRGTIAQHAFGGERLGGKKAQIIPYQQMLDELSDPTVKGAPTFSVGPRAFSLTGEVHPEPRPDLNSAFPYLLHGEDYNVTYNPVANRLMFPDFQNQWRLDKGKADRVLKSGLPPEPGYYENTMGYKPKPESTERVYPRQEVTEKLLDDLYEAGHKAGGAINHYDIGGGVKAAVNAAKPLVNRLEMGFKDVTKRIPQLQEGAKKLMSGDLTREDYEHLVNTHKPVTPYSFVPQPATAEDATRALTSDKAAKFGQTDIIPQGHQVGLRLDIPAYRDHGVWVNSIHNQGAKDPNFKTAYSNVSAVKNASFTMPQDEMLEVASGASKTPKARINGEWHPVDEESAVTNAQDYLNHPDWRQVGMDPERHGYFYDRHTMDPITHAEEVLQIGPLVLAKKPTYGNKEDFKYSKGGLTALNKKK